MESNKPDELDTDIHLKPDGTAIWTLREEGEISGTYSGAFTFKCYLDPLATLAAGRLYRELLGSYGDSASETERFIAFALSQLQKRVIKGPPFWATASESGFVGNIPDLNILS